MPIYTVYNYLSAATADYTTTTLTVDPQSVMTINSAKDVVVNQGYGVAEERIVLSSTSRFRVKLMWNVLSEADHSIIFDFYNDSAKGCGKGRTFYWTPPAQYLAASHDLTVRFDCDLDSSLQNYKNYGIMNVLLAVIGKKP